MQFMRVALAAPSAGAALVALGLGPVTRTSASAMGATRSPAKRLLIPFAGWHGRPIQPPDRHEVVQTSVAGDTRLQAHAAAIETEGERRLALGGLVSDVEDARLIWQRPGLAPDVGWLLTGDWQFEAGLASHAARTAAVAERKPGHSPAGGGAGVERELPDA